MAEFAPKTCPHDAGFYRRQCVQCGANKRALNTASSTDILAQRGVPFESKNNGAHLIVAGGRLDFWPSTGVFIERKTGLRGRGVFKLLKVLGVDRG